MILPQAKRRVLASPYATVAPTGVHEDSPSIVAVLEDLKIYVSSTMAIELPSVTIKGYAPQSP